MHRRRAAAIAVAGLALAANDYWWARGLQHWLGVHTGDSDTASVWYGFWSGFGSVIIPPVLNAFALGAVYLWHHNCHEKGCWRISRHQVDGTPWCHRHHGDARERAAPPPDPVLAEIRGLRSDISGLAEAIRLTLRQD